MSPRQYIKEKQVVYHPLYDNIVFKDIDHTLMFPKIMIILCRRKDNIKQFYFQIESIKILLCKTYTAIE